MQLHKQSQASERKRLSTDAARSSVRADIGNIAILDESDGVVTRRNPFNLNQRTLRFVPSGEARSYRYELGENSYDAAAASGGTAISGLGDDDTREIALPFAFPFFGTRYNSVFVNSDGNLTFTSGDVAITDRSLGRFVSGAPRIAGLFRDLDPTRSRTGVVTTPASGQFTVSWVAVPEYRDSGTGPLQTFQIRLFPDGRIEFAWSEVTSQEAIVGIGPGRAQGTASVVSFLNTPTGEYTSTVAERFSGTERVDIFAAAQKFYETHEDAYDYLVLYNTLRIPADDDAVAFEVTVRNNRSGYGDEHVDIGMEAGSKRRLQAIVNMGPTNQYPVDPTARVPARFSVGDTPITTLAHEAGHLFLAFASVRNEDDSRARPMLGFQTAHWNFVFNSEASLLEGNRIQDNGPGANPRFQTTAAVQGFSPLDQYLMGLRAPEDVPDMFLVTNAVGSRVSGLPRVGATFNGERRDIRIDEVIHAEGRRTPDHTVSQRRFRFAFAMIVEAGREPAPEELQQVETYRREFEQFFARATDGNGSADTSLKRALRLSLWPASGVALGGSATGSVEIESPAETPVTVLLRPQSGAIETPASVTIPAGKTQAAFPFAGRRAGVDELMAEAAGGQFETVHARVQVAAPNALRMTVAGGDFQTARPGSPLAEPVRVRISDVNEVPYPGVAVQAQVSEGGTIDRASAVTDENGVASFRWTPGGGAANELRASIASGQAVVATALGRPLLSATSVVNAASFAPGLTPGGIGTIFGANLAGSGTAEVLLNGETARVFFSSPRQINFFVPASVPAGTAEILVRNTVGSSDRISATVAAVQPGIFFDVATGAGAVTVGGVVRPVSRGETIEIYATGLGSVVPQSSGLPVTPSTPLVSVGGLNADVLYSGLAPGFAGLYQVNARVPTSTPAGSMPLSITLNGVRSNEVRIQVQ